MKKLGLIGFPLTHSFSKKYFEEKFVRENISGYEYHLFPLENIMELEALIEKEKDLIGLNVTIPYKEQVIKYLDELDASAEKVGAVNAIKITRINNKPFLKGYNTDVFGFAQSIKPFLEPKHDKALIIGTGGAAKAVKSVLEEIGVPCWFLSRSQQESERCFSLANFPVDALSHFKLIVNASPTGTFPKVDECPVINYDLITNDHLVYDLVYNPEQTLFIKKAKEKGALTVNGLSMLYHQADKAWGIFSS